MAHKVRDSAQTVRDWLADEGILALIMVGLTIVFGFILGEVQSKIGWVLLTGALIFILVVIGITVTLVRRPLQRIVHQGFEDMKLALVAGRTHWLYNLDAVIHHERDTLAREIWLVSEDLQEDVAGGPFRDVVAEKLKAGVKYVYFVPDSVETRARIQIIKAAHGYTDRISMVFLPDSFFFLVPRLDIVIYNPLSLGGIPREAFMGIPVPDTTDHFHVAVTDDFIDRLVGTLLQLYNKGAI